MTADKRSDFINAYFSCFFEKPFEALDVFSGSNSYVKIIIPFAEL